MKDYKLSEVKDICNETMNGGGCETCKFYSDGGFDCELQYSPDTWGIEKSADAMLDNVNHPQHYTSGCGFECIEMMQMILSSDEFYGFCIGNAIKYIWRHNQKGGMEDIHKAKWYLDTLLELTVTSRNNAQFGLLWDKVDKLLNQ